MILYRTSTHVDRWRHRRLDQLGRGTRRWRLGGVVVGRGVGVGRGEGREMGRGRDG